MTRNETLGIVARVGSAGQTHRPIRRYQTEAVPETTPGLANPGPFQHHVINAEGGQLVAHREARLAPSDHNDRGVAGRLHYRRSGPSSGDGCDAPDAGAVMRLLDDAVAVRPDHLDLSDEPFPVSLAVLQFPLDEDKGLGRCDAQPRAARVVELGVCVPVPGQDVLGPLKLESPPGDRGVKDGVWVVEIMQRLEVNRSEASLDLLGQGLGCGHGDPSS